MADTVSNVAVLAPPSTPGVPVSAAVLMGMPVVDGAGNSCGRVQELAVNVAEDGTRVAALVLRKRTGGETQMTLLPVSELQPGSENAVKDGVLRSSGEPAAVGSLDDYLLLERDLLDQQIIDVDGRKVVRVNDVNLAWQDEAGEAIAPHAAGPLTLRITEVEVGMRGAARRLLKGLPLVTVVSLSDKFQARPIPWSCVDLIERDPARRVKLKIGQDRLSRLHPSDIADILEELAPAEREAVFSSLPEETAAEALEEIDPKMQVALLQGLDSERAAGIVEEMDPGAAADLLAEMPEEQSEAILEEMEPDERQEMEELLEFSSNSAAGRMTTDYVSVSEMDSVADAVQALREFEGDADTITEVYLVDPSEKLKGVVTLPRLLLADPAKALKELAEVHIVCCKLHSSEGEVAELFDKYNLRSLPVVNHHGAVSGVIHAEQVIAQLREA